LSSRVAQTRAKEQRALNHTLSSEYDSDFGEEDIENEVEYDRSIESQEKEKDLVHVMFLEIPNF
jgi:hypothetical protein